jgi:hypothetical protein
LTTYQMLSGGIAEAPVAGFWTLHFGVAAAQANGGDWVMQPSMPGFESQIWAIDPGGTGSILASARQLDPPLGSFPLPTNPLPSIWSAVWIPPNYTPRTAVFSSASGTSGGGLFVHIGTNAHGHPAFGFAEVASSHFSALQVPIAPAPASCLPFLALVCLASRPTRRNY